MNDYDNFDLSGEDAFSPMTDGFIDANGTYAGYKNIGDELFDSPSDFDNEDIF